MIKLISKIRCFVRGHRDIFMRPFGCPENERIVCLDCGRTKDVLIQ